MSAEPLIKTPAQFDEWVYDFVRFGRLDVPCDFEFAWLVWRSRGLPTTTKSKLRASLFRLHDEGQIFVHPKGWVYRVTITRSRGRLAYGRVIRQRFQRGLVIYPRRPAWMDLEVIEVESNPTAPVAWTGPGYGSHVGGLVDWSDARGQQNSRRTG